MATKRESTKAARSSAARPKARAPAKKAAPRKKVVLLSGGNPQIPKGDGAAPVRAYLAALPGWKRALGKRIDALVVESVPGVQKAVRWNSPFYRVEGHGYFVSMHALTRYLKLTFFDGRALKPMPPGSSKDPNARYLDVYEDDELDEAQLRAWFQQAATLPGWTP